MRYLLWGVVLAAVALSSAENKMHPLSDEFINSLNNKKSTWKAGRNFDSETPMSSIRGLMGVLPKKEGTPSKLPLKIHPKVAVPESFDSRENWPECAAIIGEIRDQANCGSCWAFGAVEVMSDRTCIGSGGRAQIAISAQDLLSCCMDCGFGCEGGFPEMAFFYWTNPGIVTGGGYGSGIGCKTYSLPPCDHHLNGTLPPCGPTQPTPECVDVCDDGSIPTKNNYTAGTGYRVDPNEEQIKIDISSYGPVESSFAIYEDFLNYKSGVYQYISGEFVGLHSVKILGWGVEEGTPYWLAANSWNSEWGDAGYFKILRGQDECGIEIDIITGFPP